MLFRSLEMAGLDFHERVNAGFKVLAAEDPARIRTVVSDGSKQDTARRVFSELDDLFPWMADESVCTPEFFDALVMKRAMAGRS